LANNQRKPLYLAVDDTSVYWTNSLGANIMTVPKIGGTATQFSVASQPWDITVDAAAVYWTNVGDSTVVKALKSGGGPTKLADQTGTPYALAADADNIYFVTSSGQESDLYRVPKVGGTVVPLDSGSAGGPFSAVVSDEFVFWSHRDFGGSSAEVYRVSKAGGNAMLVGGEEFQQGKILAVDSCDLFSAGITWTHRRPFDEAPVYPRGPGVMNPVIDATHLYGVHGSAIYKMSK
jgi:hypothetical protein